MNNRKSAANTNYPDLSTFKPVKNYEFRYLIHESGLVYDKLRKVILKPSKDASGFDRVSLTGINDKDYAIRVSKLLQLSFLEEEDFSEYEPVLDRPNYLINKNGSLYSIKDKQFISYSIHSGYARYNAFKWKRREVHKVLADQFIPNPDNLATVNHKDGNKLNNDLFNLEWMSAGDNVKHAWDTGLNTGCYTVAIEFIDRDENSFCIIGLDNVGKVFGIKKSCISTLLKRYGNTDRFVPSGFMKGYKMNRIKCKVQRLSSNGVTSSDVK